MPFMVLRVFEGLSLGRSVFAEFQMRNAIKPSNTSPSASETSVPSGQEFCSPSALTPTFDKEPNAERPRQSFFVKQKLRLGRLIPRKLRKARKSVNPPSRYMNGAASEFRGGSLWLTQPCFCLCLGFSQITITWPLRLMILHFSQISFTDGLTFIVVSSFRNYDLLRQVIRPRVRSYGDNSMVTLSPG